MEDIHTTSTTLGEKLFYIVHYIVHNDCFVYYEVGTQWDTMDMFLFEISIYMVGTLPFILVPVTRSTYVFPLT